MGVFELTIWARTRFNQPLINPTLVTTIVVILILKFANIKWQAFEQASSYITFWLQPVVVCLAVPLYIQWQKFVCSGCRFWCLNLWQSLVGIVSGVWIVRALGGSYDSMIATAAKSLTMPIAIEVTQALGGLLVSRRQRC